METIVKVILVLFIGSFLVSCFLFFIGKRRFNDRVMQVSTAITLACMALLFIALGIDGKLFKDLPKVVNPF